MTIKAPYSPSSASEIDFFCRDTDDKWWNGTAFVTFNVANYTTYRIAATESPADSGLYEAAEPIGTFEFELRLRAASWATSYVVAGPQQVGGEVDAAAIIAAIKADAELGTGGLLADAKRSRQFIANKRTRTVIGARQVRYTVRSDDDSADEFSVDYDPMTGNISPI